MRIVIKVGTSTLTHQTGKINLKIMEKLVRVISDIRNQGHSVVLVSSGAMALGTAKLNLPEKPCTTQGKQAVAAVGQCELMAIYDRFFLEYGYQVAQILLTKDVVEIPDRKENVINTFNELIKYGCVPIVNENDTVEVEEIKFGDNDTLSAIVAYCIKADLLILLTDIDALYDSDPKINPNAKPISIVENIDDKIHALAGEAGSDLGTGGMITKIKAAEIANSHNIDMYIASGSNPEIIYDILDGKEVGTLFKAPKNN